jgi:hypothetical protein
MEVDFIAGACRCPNNGISTTCPAICGALAAERKFNPID